MDSDLWKGENTILISRIARNMAYYCRVDGPLGHKLLFLCINFLCWFKKVCFWVWRKMDGDVGSSLEC